MAGWSSYHCSHYGGTEEDDKEEDDVDEGFPHVNLTIGNKSNLKVNSGVDNE